MPEGDTVWRTAHALHDALADRLLTRTDLRVPKLATVDLSGRRVLNVTPRGKHLLARIEGGLTLHSHLGMDGSWRITATHSTAADTTRAAPRDAHATGHRPTGTAHTTGAQPPGAPSRASASAPTSAPGKGSRDGKSGPAHQIRAVLATEAHTATGYRLPLLELLRTSEEPAVLGHLGPDLLGPDWDQAEAERRLLADPARPLADALLDQRNLAGIGNVYAAELCFLAHTSPWTPVGSLTPPLPSRLLTVAKRLLEANKDRPVRRTTNGTRSDRNLAVYGREHRPCHRCGTSVRTGQYGPADRRRTVWYCPHCQPTPK